MVILGHRQQGKIHRYTRVVITCIPIRLLNVETNIQIQDVLMVETVELFGMDPISVTSNKSTFNKVDKLYFTKVFQSKQKKKCYLCPVLTM